MRRRLHERSSSRAAPNHRGKSGTDEEETNISPGAQIAIENGGVRRSIFKVDISRRMPHARWLHAAELARGPEEDVADAGICAYRLEYCNSICNPIGRLGCRDKSKAPSRMSSEHTCTCMCIGSKAVSSPSTRACVGSRRQQEALASLAGACAPALW